ncbi:MAG: hypothetical protein M1485_03445 [Chloroflexi bacterium]|nr:hypothetical protein [Chloroflexota bacterium]
MIFIPTGKLSVAPSNDDDAAARRRKELREKLLRGDEVVVTQEGQVEEKGKQDPKKPAPIEIPPGKLAASFFWYEQDPELLESEKQAMQQFFPEFKLEKLEDDGRLCWVGQVAPKNVRKNAVWSLQVIYDNNHPHKSSYGGSMRVYSIEPDLDKMHSEIGPIPHLLRDSRGHVYICTARPEDVQVGETQTSAASALAWAAKWITVFELWLAGDVKTEEFRDHTF